MCNPSHSESGYCIHIDKCNEYQILEQKLKAAQDIIDKVRGLTASWEQYLNCTTLEDSTAMFKYVDNGMIRLTASLTNYDNKKGV